MVEFQITHLCISGKDTNQFIEIPQGYLYIYILGCIESTIVENCEVVRNVMDNFDSFGFTTTFFYI